MDLPINPPPPDIPALLRQWDLRPDKSLGQNFLIDEAALRKVVDSAGIRPEDRVLEIGPGLGSLTRYLAVRARAVAAVEIDRNLIAPLQNVLATFHNVKVVEGDILRLDPRQLLEDIDSQGDENTGREYLVVANIPYYITSALIRHLLETSHPPRRMVLTVQKEVAERITSEPGDMNLLALSVQVYGQPEITATIPAGAFYPPPRVDSAVVRVNMAPAPLIPASLLPVFFRLAKAGFSQKRKTLRNSLSGGLAISTKEAETLLRGSGIDPMRRAETLSLTEWRIMTEKYLGEKE